MALVVFSTISSWCLELVCGLWVWHCLVILITLFSQPWKMLVNDMLFQWSCHFGRICCMFVWLLDFSLWKDFQTELLSFLRSQWRKDIKIMQAQAALCLVCGMEFGSLSCLFKWMCWFTQYKKQQKKQQKKQHKSVISILSMLFLLHVSPCKWQLANWTVLIYMYYDVYWRFLFMIDYHTQWYLSVDLIGLKESPF